MKRNAVLFIALALTAIGLVANASSSRADASDVSITSVSCDTSPELTFIRNAGTTAVPLVGFRLQSYAPSGPGQDFAITDFGVSTIGAGVTLTFQSGTNSIANPSAGVYRIGGTEIYRDGDPLDYARLYRNDGTSQTVQCGPPPATATAAPPTATPTATPAATATPSPTATPTQLPRRAFIPFVAADGPVPR